MKVTEEAVYQIHMKLNKIVFNYLPPNADMQLKKSSPAPMEVEEPVTVALEPEPKRQKTDEMAE